MNAQRIVAPTSAKRLQCRWMSLRQRYINTPSQIDRTVRRFCDAALVSQMRVTDTASTLHKIGIANQHSNGKLNEHLRFAEPRYHPFYHEIRNTEMESAIISFSH